MSTPEPEPEQRYPRRFYLYRGEDETGISGTGVVADGVQWQDGTATLKWLGEHSSEVSWRAMPDVVHIHGHGGKTMVVWRDDEDGYPLQAVREKASFFSPLAQGMHAILRNIQSVSV